MTCDSILSKRYGDFAVVPYFNVRLVFLLHMASMPAAASAMSFIETSVPWSLIALQLNSLSIGFEHHARIETLEFPKDDEQRPCPEDWSLRGLLWANVFPDGWFSADDEPWNHDARQMELPSTRDRLRERVLWLGLKLAAYKTWLNYDSGKKRFQATRDQNSPRVDIMHDDGTSTIAASKTSFINKISKR